MCYGFFCNVVDQAVELGAKAVSPFGFGEPLMDGGLADKIAYCSDRRLSTFITTNAGLLSRSRSVELLDAGLSNIRFSFHAITPLQHETVHRNISWLTAYRNFGNFVALNRKRGHPCTVHISCIPMASETVDDIRATWEPHCDYLEIWRPHGWGGAKDFRGSYPVRKKTCGRPFNGPLQIQADGTVIPCCFLTNSEIVCGDTTSESIESILNGVEYTDLRQAHTTGNLDGYPCATCDQLNDDGLNPLLYSNRDASREIGKTSTCKTSVLR